MAKTKKPGMSPGSVVYVGKEKEAEVKIDIIDYKETNLEEKPASKVEDCFPFKKKPTVTWMNVTGVHNVEILEKLGKHFDVHPLVLEDIANTHQRPKFEDFDSYIFMALKMLQFDEKKHEISNEQVSIVLGKNFVISFQEHEGDVFDPVRQRIRSGKGRIRKMGSDYLAYALMDAIVDNYFILLEKVGDKIESLEQNILDNPTSEVLNNVYSMKRELIELRKSVWPLREVISNLQRAESKLVKKSTEAYLRDLYEHTIQVIDTIESYRDMVSGLLDFYLSTISNKMNEVMKVLTIFASIFIPLTFVAGMYGMNFDFMPELHWKWSYPLLWVLVSMIGISMFMYFRRKGWV
ncbi:MAG: magnesium/cobalt transporter CorA [archaeon]